MLAVDDHDSDFQQLIDDVCSTKFIMRMITMMICTLLAKKICLLEEDWAYHNIFDQIVLIHEIQRSLTPEPMKMLNALRK